MAFAEGTRNTNTKKNYGTYSKQYKEFAGEKDFPLDSDVTLGSFMRASAQRGLGRSTCTSTIPSAVADLFRYENGGNPTKTPFLKQIKKAVKLITKGSTPRIAITLEILQTLARGVNFNSFTSVRDHFLILLMMAGMLRGSEAAALEEDDIELLLVDGVEVLMIRVQKSKTDQLRKGDTVFVGGPDSTVCPVRWFKIFVGYHRVKGAPTFFHSAVPAGKIPSEIPSICGATTNTTVKERLMQIGVDPRGYGSHSCRRGGASAAAAANIDICLIKRHGRWLSDAVFAYVDDSLQRKLMVSDGIFSGFKAIY